MPFNKKGEDNPDANRIISIFNNLASDKKIELISYFISELKKLRDESEALGKKEICIPVGIFDNDALSSLEAIVKYLKEILKLKFSKIGKLLNRSNKTIWTTHSNAVKKMPSSFGLIS